MEPKQIPWRKVALIVAGGVALHWLLNHFSVVVDAFSFVWGLLFPLLLGGILAFLLNLPMSFAQRKILRNRGGRFGQVAALTIALLLSLLFIAFVVFLVLPQLIRAFAELFERMPGYIARIREELAPYTEYVPHLRTFLSEQNINWEQLANNLWKALTSGTGVVFSSAIGFTSSLIGGIGNFFIGLIFSIYLLLGKEKLLGQANRVLTAYVPEKRARRVREVATLTNRSFRLFVTGQCTEAFIEALMFLLVLTVGRFEYALPISVLVGALSLIPIFGAVIGCVISALLLLLVSGFVRALAFVIVFLILQQIEANIIYPRVVGSSVGLPALWVLAAVTVGGSLMGIKGMLLFIPLCSVIYTLWREDIHRRLGAKTVAEAQVTAPGPEDSGEPE